MRPEKLSDLTLSNVHQNININIDKVINVSLQYYGVLF